MKHTQDVWRMLWDSELDCYQLDVDGGRVIADVYFQDLLPSEEVQAARLIAAAPELLEALEEVMLEKEFILPSIVENIQAAIKKAKGE